MDHRGKLPKIVVAHTSLLLKSGVHAVACSLTASSCFLISSILVVAPRYRRGGSLGGRSWRHSAARTAVMPLGVSTEVELPTEVDDFNVCPICVVPRPSIPGARHQICALVVSDEEDQDSDVVLWQPPAGSAAQQAISSLNDAFGVLGVWPAAWVAAERVLQVIASQKRLQNQAPPLKILELGCGAGLPSLCALACGAEVLATDLEELPLKLLEAAAEAQNLPGSLAIQTLDLLAAAGVGQRQTSGLVQRRRVSCPSDTAYFDIIVCSDCLYKLDVAEAIARVLARAILRYPTTKVIVTDANRRGRNTFLETLAKCTGLGLGPSTQPQFIPTHVPSWAADDARDPFDGTETSEVGLLQLY